MAGGKTKGGLLTIVRAEERAERLVTKAEAQKKEILRKTLDVQVTRLRDFEAPKMKEINLQPLEPDLNRLEEQAKKNRDKAVKRILRELNAAA